MKHLTIIAGLGLLVPVVASAQYSGGMGRGDVQASFVPAGVGIRPVPGGANTTLRAWPVPATGTLQLDRTVTATVHDIEGRIVGSVARANTVDISGLAPGTYVLRTERDEMLRFTRE